VCDVTNVCGGVPLWRNWEVTQQQGQTDENVILDVFNPAYYAIKRILCTQTLVNQIIF
jgi:hypothetical protein